MAQQLIFTSTPQGLEPGRTGYCTVARHKDLRHRLVRELERLSVYDFGQQVGGNRVDISIYRKIILGSEEYFVLSKICDAGLDYTNRTNYLAHHLILDGFEIATSPSPAEIFLNWNGWKSKWEENSRYLTPGEEVTLTGFKSKGLVPCRNWLSFTNDPGNAATLVSPGAVNPIVLENAPAKAEHLLQLFAESSALLKISLDAWDYSFTTFLQGNDDTKAFAWIGIEGQPIGERLKQGGLRNYIDLQNWSSSIVTDQPDASLAHVARKGPTAPPSKRVKKGASSNTRSPLSEQQVQQIKGASSGYMSAAPSGSTVKAQEASTKKEKKKRPWLLQLAVISTALCLLGALIVGLAYNLGDWFNQDDPDGQSEQAQEPIKDLPIEEPSDNQSVIPGAFAQLNQVEYLKIIKKDRFLDWVKVDVGTRDPLKVTIDDDQKDIFERALDSTEEGEEIKVVLTEKKGKIIFDKLSKAPLPNVRGNPKKITIDDAGSLILDKSKDRVSFNIEDQQYHYDLRLTNDKGLARIEKLAKILETGEQVPLNLRLENSRVVFIEPFKLPGDVPVQETVEEPIKPKGEIRTLSQLKGSTPEAFEPEQKRILLRVSGTRTVPYIFKEEEKNDIQKLHNFLLNDERGVDLKYILSEDESTITFIDYKLPEPLKKIVEEQDLSPSKLIARKKFLFWVPGEKKSGQWQIDRSKSSLTFNDPEVSSLLFTYFSKYLNQEETPVIWMTRYENAAIFNQKQFENEQSIKEFSFEARDHPLEKGETLIVSLKSGKNYSFDFEISNKTESVVISYDLALALKSIIEGALIRLPLPDERGQCLDLFLLSNKHHALDAQSEKIPSYSLPRKELSLSAEGFKFLYPEGDSYVFAFSVLNSSPELTKVLFDSPDTNGLVNWRSFVNSQSGSLEFPKVLVQLNEENSFISKVNIDLTYFQPTYEGFLKEKIKFEANSKKYATFPEPEVYQRLVEYGSVLKQFLVYQPGASYSSYVFNLPIGFIKNRFRWDEVRFNNLKGELDLTYNIPDLALSSEKLFSYWSKLSDELDLYLTDKINKNFTYNHEQASGDIKLLFEFLNLTIQTEKALGVNLKQVRSNLLSNGKAYSLLIKEIASLAQTQPELNESFKNYKNFYEKQLADLAESILNFETLNSAISTVEEPGKNEIFKREKDNIISSKKYANYYDQKNKNFLTKQNEVIQSQPIDVASHIKKVISGIPWTLAIYKKNPNGDWVKQSDFLRLAPPSNL